VRLASSDGACVELRPVQYQFGPSTRPNDGEFDFDANWVVVDGHVRTPEGTEYSFRDLCLLTDEMRRISRWLSAVADHRVPPMPLPLDESRLSTFTEPNVAFSVSADHQNEVRLRVHLSLESGPPSLGAERSDLYEYFVELTLTPDDLEVAAASWDVEIAAFPRR